MTTSEASPCEEIASELAHQMRTSLLSANYIYELMRTSYGSAISEGDLRILQTGLETNTTKIQYAAKLLESLHTGSSAMVLVDMNLGAPARVFKGITGSYEKRAREQDIVFSASIKLDEDKHARLDIARMQIVLENLIENAVKYSLGQRKNISVEVWNTADSLLMQVSDTGIGIPIKEQSQIFNRFHRAENARKSHPGGNGVGLYLSKRYVEEHGGTISFESEENKGTTFSVAVPLTPKH